MRRRALLLFLFLFGVAAASRSADAVSIKIRQVGLENIYALGNSPTLISFDVRNTTVQSIPISLLVDEVSLENNASSVTTSIQLPLLLSPAEEIVLWEHLGGACRHRISFSLKGAPVLRVAQNFV